MSTDATFNNSFRVETTSLYAVGITFIVTRLASRVRKLGFRGLQPDDWIMLQGTLWYTLLYVASDRIIFGGGSNYMTEEDIANLTPETKQARIVGSKWVLLSEQSMVLTIWTCKLCMLFIYRRLTQGLKQLKVVNWIFIYVVLGFLAVQIAFFTNCRPFNGYWSVPPISEQCWSYGHYAIIEGCFNVSADLSLLLVGIPLLFKARIPVQQKLILVAIFGMGSFVIAAALLCKVYSLYPPLISYAYLNWFFREASVSVYVTNIPVLYSLIREAFPAVARWGYTKKGSSTRSGDGTSRRRTDVPMKPFNRLGSSSDETDDLGPTQSQEHIISYNMKDLHALEIHKAVTFSVEKGTSDDDDLEMGHHAQVPQERTGSPHATTR